MLARGATHFADLADRLYRVGIPVEVQGVGDLYRQPEIQIALDWLRIIANRHQDVPLVAVLRTMGFTDDDLARIRLHNRGWLFDVMRRIAESGGEADESAVLSSDVLLAKISACESMMPHAIMREFTLCLIRCGISMPFLACSISQAICLKVSDGRRTCACL